MADKELAEDSSPVTPVRTKVESGANPAELDPEQIALAETHLLLSLYRTLVESVDVRTGLSSALEIICRLTGWELGMAWLRSADYRELRSVSDWHADNATLDEFARVSAERTVSPEVGIAGRVWARGTPEWTTDLGAEAPESFPLASLAARTGIKAAFGVPIVDRQGTAGVLMFYARETREADTPLLQMVGRVATQLGFALRHKQAEEELRTQQARLRARHDALEMDASERAAELQFVNHALRAEIVQREQVEEHLLSRVRYQEALSQVRELALGETSLPALLEEICERIARTLDVEYCKILELEPDKQALVLRTGVGWRAGLVGGARVAAGTGSQAGYTLTSNQPVIVANLRTETRFSAAPLLLDHGVVSGVSVVIPGRGEPFGVLGVHTTTDRTFDRHDVSFLESVAHILYQIIEQRRSAAAIQRSESWLRHLVATTQDAVVSIDRRGCVVLFNASAERIFGYAAAEIVGRKVNVLMAQPYADEHDGYIARYERTREPRAIGKIRKVTAKRKDGTAFPIELSVTEIEVDDDVRYAAFIRDVSETVELQRRLVENERLAAIGATAAGIGHEIANPLNGIYLTLQLVEQRATRQPSLDERIARDVTRVKREIGRLNHLVQEFRALSRKQKYRFRPTDLSRVIDDVIDLQRPLCEARKIRILCEKDATVAELPLDEDKLKQALLNLLKNSIEAMPDGGTLAVTTTRGDGHVTIAVSDTGTGIAPETELFATFFTTKREGSGLGLIVVRQIVSAHRGTITYESRVGEGTTFRISLPLDASAGI